MAIFALGLNLSFPINVKCEMVEYCSRDVACIQEHRKDKNKIADIRVVNKQDFPITVTLDMTDFLNMKADLLFPITKTLNPYEEILFTTIKTIDPNVRWNWRVSWNWKPGSLYANHDDTLYALPFSKGAEFQVVRGFNEPPSHVDANKHSIDWNMPEGTPVYAARDGIVGDVIEHNTLSGGIELADKANYVWVVHRDGTGSVYLHLKHYGSSVRIGQKIKVGDLLGYSGNTGYSEGPHLHFGVYLVKDGWTSSTVPIEFKSVDGKGFVPHTGKIYRRSE